MFKKLLALLSVSAVLTGCLETTQEITLKEDGSGSLSTTSDMGTILAMVKQMGGGSELEKAGDQVMDTTITLGSEADSITDMSSAEREMLKKGSMNMKLNLQNDEFSTRLNFPFSKPEEIGTFNKLTGKLFSLALKKQMGDAPLQGMGGDVPPYSSFDDYFQLEFSNGELKKKLNKEKYQQSASTDEYLNGLKQASGMGIPVGATYVINLPRPAEKAEGKNVTLSDDKMKVTVKVELDDFFNDPEKFEFKIKY